MVNEKLLKLVPKPLHVAANNGQLTAKTGSAANVQGVDKQLAEKLIRYLFKDTFTFSPNADTAVLNIVENESTHTAGAYRLEISDMISVYAGDYTGIANALQTLAAICNKDTNGLCFPCCVIEDSPFKSQRGIHFYLPPADLIDDFLILLDAMAALKYNTVILEIGGAMELEHHPEVNKAWLKFCREAREYPGGPRGLQGSEAYWKDSTHVELGGSGLVKKEDVRRIAEHCAMLGMEVIPEIQALSHCYYLTLAHPEIAERPYERWPDSYCPSMDESYILYGEVAEEILEVTKPKRVSIGHDEIRVLCECPRCRTKTGHELLAYDINRLHSFYKTRGIQILMWGEMLQSFTSWKGAPTGGVGRPQYTDRYGRSYQLVDTYKAAGMVPKDILMIDWYYSMASDTEKGVAGNGFQEIFGNFRGSQVADWDLRSRSQNVLGAEVSTWCVPNEYELGFNGWLYELVFSSMLLWQNDYHDGCQTEFARLTENYLPILQSKLSGSRGFDGRLDTLSGLKTVPGQKKDITYRFGTISKDTAERITAGGLTPLNDGASLIVDGDADSLVFFHSTAQAPDKRFTTWMFLDKAPRMPASYAIDYEDGMCVICTVEFGATGHYGAAIGDIHSRLGYVRPNAHGEMLSDIDDQNTVNEDKISRSPMFNPVDPWRNAAVYSCRYAELDTPEGIKTVYAYEWKNPYPGHRIKAVRFINEPASPLEAQLYAVGLVNTNA